MIFIFGLILAVAIIVFKFLATIVIPVAIAGILAAAWRWLKK